jgi:peptidoglycan/xylan/chitin deacetylase (PgdA/CDA1 family)
LIRCFLRKSTRIRDGKGVAIKRNICELISFACDRFTKFGRKEAGIRILLYHSIGTNLPHDTYGMGISIESFKEQIRIISKDKRTGVIPLRFSEDHLSFAENSDKVKLAITFDDGYRDNLYTAAPVLLEWGVPFTVFVTSSFLQNNSSVYLSKEDLRELSDMPGVTIGSHGMTHCRLTKLNDRDLVCELLESRSRIEDIIGKKVDMLSYPHGKIDRRVTDAAVESGYRLGLGSRFGINLENTDPMFLRRTEIWDGDSEDVFRRKYSGAWDWYGYYQTLRGL